MSRLNGFFFSHYELRSLPQKLVSYPTSRPSTQLRRGVRNTLPPAHILR
jgi:hypothetical protein